MGQRTRILSQIVGVRGWKVVESCWESAHGERVVPVAGYDLPPDVVLVLRMARRWAVRCGLCFGLVAGGCHEHCRVRRWADLPWAGRRVVLEYAPERVKCGRCDRHATELLGWADRGQRQTRRLQHHLALDAFSMPLSHVATKYGLAWRTVRRAEAAALERWERTRPAKPLRQVGIDEKWLGRRHKRPEKFVTIVSDLDTGEPVWIGYGRGADTVKQWLATLSPEQKAQIVLVACDMHGPFMKAIGDDAALAHVPIVHDPFHVMKRAGQALTELRRQTFFRGVGIDLGDQEVA